MPRKRELFPKIHSRDPLDIEDFSEVRAGKFRLTVAGKLDDGIKTVTLPRLHTRILATLMRNHSYVVTHEFLLSQAYPQKLQKARSAEHIQVALVRIRKLLRDEFNVQPIRNIKNRGYAFE